jgi:(1->4)-alpha-D-glucan 1-alpha-D-glucosylmutase
VITALSDRIRPFAWSNSLSQKLIQLTMPGVPDVYQGSEFWEGSLVDPDNRRPVDFARRRAALRALEAPPTDHELAKLWITSRALRVRRDRPEFFSGYTPIIASKYLVAFDRGGAITLATRLPVGLAVDGWHGAVVPLGSEYLDVLTGRSFSGECPVANVLNTYPVALLVAQ